MLSNADITGGKDNPLETVPDLGMSTSYCPAKHVCMRNDQCYPAVFICVASYNLSSKLFLFWQIDSKLLLFSVLFNWEIGKQKLGLAAARDKKN